MRSSTTARTPHTDTSIDDELPLDDRETTAHRQGHPRRSPLTIARTPHTDTVPDTLPLDDSETIAHRHSHRRRAPSTIARPPLTFFVFGVGHNDRTPDIKKGTSTLYAQAQTVPSGTPRTTTRPPSISPTVLTMEPLPVRRAWRPDDRCSPRRPCSQRSPRLSKGHAEPDHPHSPRHPCSLGDPCLSKGHAEADLPHSPRLPCSLGDPCLSEGRAEPDDGRHPRLPC